MPIQGDIMEILHTNQTVSISELKRNPAAVMRKAGHQPVAVLNHNKPAFYLLGSKLFARTGSTPPGTGTGCAASPPSHPR